jgi:hypothetical protein
VSIDYQRLERTLTREFRQYHVAAQVYRIAGVFLGVLGVQLASGWHDWTWKGLYALLAAAGYGTLRQIAPTVPWKTFLGHVQAAQFVAAQKDAQAAVDAGVSTLPSSAIVYTPVTKPATQPAQSTPSPNERPDPAPAP